ncbi:type IV secretion system protein, partial [Pseudomonas syringae]
GGGSQWTRDFAIAPMRFTVAIGAKLFVLTLIVGLIIQSAKQWLAAYTNDEASLMTMVGLALVCCYLTKTIPDLIGAMISGTSMGGGSAIGGMAVAGAAGAAAAAATIATAGAAAPAAALGAAGTGSAAGARAAGVGGLAGAINSSFAGASSAGGAASSMGAAASSGVGANTGGAAAQGASSAGAKVGGSSANPAGQASTAPSSPSSGVQQAAKQAGKAAQGNGDKDQQTTPKGGVVSSGSALYQAADGGAKMLGVMASIAVPGMENAHALSLGTGSPQPVPDDTYSTTPANEAESAAEASQAEPNVIRPASDTNSTPGRLASLKVPGMTSDDQPEK